MSPTLRPYLQLHFCVLLWGFTAILGKLISLPAATLVWWRMLIVTVCLAALPRVWRGLRALPPRLLAIYGGIGIIVTLHWLTFYGAIKLSNASVAVTCLAVGPALTALIEPLIARRPFERRELLLGVAVIPGVALVVGGVDPAFRLGIAVGVASALFVSVFASLNKRYVHAADPLLVTAVELGVGLLALSLVLPWLLPAGVPAFAWPGARDLQWLVVLALGCTLLPFTLSLVALRHLSAFTAQLAVNLEPLYAIALAALFLGEQHELTAVFYLGVTLILLVVFIHPWLQRRARRPLHAENLAESDGPAPV